MIASYLGQNHQLWDQWLPEFRFAINTAKEESTGFTPAELALGRVIKGPLDRLIGKAPSPNDSRYSLLERQMQLGQLVKQRIKVAQGRQAKNYNSRRREVVFQEGDLVWVRSHPVSEAIAFYSAKLAPKWSGPAMIKRKLGPVNYQVKWVDRPEKVETINVVNLKPYFGVSP
ncbi:UNVERIFIED_CONTAM: hypothetical protein FKN15_040805 [Acipenser sinensis]